MADKVRAVCPTCGEHLGTFSAEGQFSARWWADKAVVEHEADSHD